MFSDQSFFTSGMKLVSDQLANGTVKSHEKWSLKTGKFAHRLTGILGTKYWGKNPSNLVRFRVPRKVGSSDYADLCHLAPSGPNILATLILTMMILYIWVHRVKNLWPVTSFVPKNGNIRNYVLYKKRGEYHEKGPIWNIGTSMVKKSIQFSAEFLLTFS